MGLGVPAVPYQILEWNGDRARKAMQKTPQTTHCDCDCITGGSLLPPVAPRAHKNGRLEKERVTPIEAHSPGKIIEPY